MATSPETCSRRPRAAQTNTQKAQSGPNKGRTSSVATDYSDHRPSIGATCWYIQQASYQKCWKERSIIKHWCQNAAIRLNVTYATISPLLTWCRDSNSISSKISFSEKQLRLFSVGSLSFAYGKCFYCFKVKPHKIWFRSKNTVALTHTLWGYSKSLE
jgi:hypothetical protein